MDGTAFDSLVRRLVTHRSRRRLLHGLIASVVGPVGAGLPLDQLVEAKRGGKGKGGGKDKNKKCKDKSKVTICHNGQTITISNCAWKAHEKHGDTMGACTSTPPDQCAGRNDHEPCTLPIGGTAVCCSGTCARLFTPQHCMSCDDVCQAATDTCSGFGSGDDPNSGCCAVIDSVCDPAAPDRCCNESTCTGTLNGQTVCCGVSLVSACTVNEQCCSGGCNLGSGQCAYSGA